MMAAQSGHDQLIQLLHSEANLVNATNETALMLAAKNNHPKCVKLLLNEATKQDFSGLTAMMKAVVGKSLESVLCLKDVESGMKNRWGQTALMLAAQ